MQHSGKHYYEEYNTKTKHREIKNEKEEEVNFPNYTLLNTQPTHIQQSHTCDGMNEANEEK